MGENAHRCQGVASCSALTVLEDMRIGTIRVVVEKNDKVGLHMR